MARALPALYARMLRTSSPVRQATVLHQAIAYLKSIRREDIIHIMFGHTSASRSAALCLGTFTVDLHPLVGVDEHGIKIMQHFVSCHRNGGARAVSDLDLAYVSKHAIGRLHERERHLTRNGTTAMLAVAGVLGDLTRNSAKHIAGELCLHIGDTLIVGSLKHSIKPLDNGGEANGTFYDVRTALPADEVKNQEMLEQGRTASDVVARWFTNPLADDSTLADQIPFLPRRSNNYTLRSAVVRH